MDWGTGFSLGASLAQSIADQQRQREQMRQKALMDSSTLANQSLERQNLQSTMDQQQVQRQRAAQGYEQLQQTAANFRPPADDEQQAGAQIAAPPVDPASPAAADGTPPITTVQQPSAAGGGAPAWLKMPQSLKMRGPEAYKAVGNAILAHPKMQEPQTQAALQDAAIRSGLDRSSAYDPRQELSILQLYGPEQAAKYRAAATTNDLSAITDAATLAEKLRGQDVTKDYYNKELGIQERNANTSAGQLDVAKSREKREQENQDYDRGWGPIVKGAATKAIDTGIGLIPPIVKTGMDWMTGSTRGQVEQAKEIGADQRQKEKDDAAAKKADADRQARMDRLNKNGELKQALAQYVQSQGNVRATMRDSRERAIAMDNLKQRAVSAMKKADPSLDTSDIESHLANAEVETTPGWFSESRKLVPKTGVNASADDVAEAMRRRGIK